MTSSTILHVSDLHFGKYADLEQVAELERIVPTLEPTAIAVSGDLTQRARHGEFQRALVFVEDVSCHAPTLVIPGNHDIEWWQSPLGIRGERVKYGKYLRYFHELRPVMELPGLVVAGALSSYGVALGSLTHDLNDIAVKGHLPRSEIDRVREIFARAPVGAARVLVLHHNVLPGPLSRRMGLAHWRQAQERLLATSADVILCGHDHHEGADQIHGRLAVSTSGTHSFRSRGGRASAFNMVRIESTVIHIQHWRWDPATSRFQPSDRFSFARQDSSEPAISLVDGV